MSESTATRDTAALYKSLADATTPADAALACAALGWLVFPTHGVRALPDDDGRLQCTCGESNCDRAGKHPTKAASRGRADATTAANRIASWWKAGPWNVSLSLGRASGLYVLDVAQGGDEALGELQRQHGALPETLESRSGKGGKHLFFKYPGHGTWPSTKAKLGARIDTVGERGWVIVPPSIHRSGIEYEWIVARPPAEMPQWLLDLLQPGVDTADAKPISSLQLTDALADDAPTAAAATPSDVAPWAGDPYVACAGDVVAGDVRPALGALAKELALRDVRPETLVHAIRLANEQNCRPPLSSDEAETVAYEALAAEHARQARVNDDARSGQVDPLTAAGQRRLADLRRRERSADKKSASPAVKALLLTYLGVIDFDDDARELTVVRYETRETVRLPVGGSDRELQPVVIRVLGNLGMFASRAHDAGKAKHVIAVLQEIAKDAPQRQVEQEDSEPVQLVDAILTLDVWKNDETVGYSRPTPAMLISRDGFHPTQGLGFITDERGRKILAINTSRLASGSFSKNAQFRTKKAAELTRIFAEAPGYIGVVKSREVRNALGDLKFHGVDMGEFARITGRGIVSVPSTTPPPSNVTPIRNHQIEFPIDEKHTRPTAPAAENAPKVPR